jgi:hypothetical protein
LQVATGGAVVKKARSIFYRQGAGRKLEEARSSEKK